MGSVYYGIPQEFIRRLQERYHLRTFVETGTGLGGTSAFAASLFDQVITIEFSKELYDRARARYGNLPNVRFIFADSRLALTELLPSLEEAALFWLDSHWSGGPTYGERDQCPLIDELRLINQYRDRGHMILIDDARLFLSPPPPPHNTEDWPSIGEVVRELEAGASTYTAIFQDVIFATPDQYKPVVVDYCLNPPTLNKRPWYKRKLRQIRRLMKHRSRQVIIGVLGRERAIKIKTMLRR